MQADIGIVTIRVENWERMLAYYRDALGLVPQFVDAPSQYAMFKTGQTRLALEGPAKPAFERRPGVGAVMTNLKVENLAREVETLAAQGVNCLTGIHSGPGYDYVVIADPEGNEHVIYQAKAKG